MQQHHWQEFIYLSALLAFLLIGFISRKELNFKKTLKYSAAWLGIIGIFIIIYAYRFEFLDLKNRVSGELFPSKAILDQKSGKIIINISQKWPFLCKFKAKWHKNSFYD